MAQQKLRVPIILLLSLYIQIFLYKINSADAKHRLSTVEFRACLLISNQEQLRPPNMHQWITHTLLMANLWAYAVFIIPFSFEISADALDTYFVIDLTHKRECPLDVGILHPRVWWNGVKPRWREHLCLSNSPDKYFSQIKCTWHFVEFN